MIIGASSSPTETVKEQLEVFPDASVTVYVSVVIPIGNVPPLPKPAVCTAVEPEQLSVPTGAV